MKYVSCCELNSKSLFEFTKKTLTTCVNIQNCIAQTYDGASIISGNQSYMQPIFQKEVSIVLYIYCYNHRLNYFIINVCKNIPEIRKFITLLHNSCIALKQIYCTRGFLGPLERNNHILPCNWPNNKWTKKKIFW